MRAATKRKGIIMKKQYFVDMVNEKVYVDPVFVKKAGQFGAAEFDKFMELRTALPAFKFEEKNLNVSSKNVYSELTYEVMEAFINFHVEENRRKKVIDEFKAVRAEAVFKKAPYSFVKSWFLSKYKTEYNKSSFAIERKGKKAEAIQKLNHPATTSGQ